MNKFDEDNKLPRFVVINMCLSLIVRDMLTLDKPPGKVPSLQKGFLGQPRIQSQERTETSWDRVLGPDHQVGNGFPIHPLTIL